MADLGLTHVAFAVRDLERSIRFYQRYAAMRVVHRRPGRRAPGSDVAWLSDLTRPFVIVLIQTEGGPERPLGPCGHLGVACESREEVDRLAALAREEGALVAEPTDSGPPVGYWAFLRDPDGNNLEIAYGQEVAFTVEDAVSATDRAIAPAVETGAGPRGLD